MIHADFITTASREDVQEQSSWNKALLEQVAATFPKAILSLCDHPTLQYTWMRYLPTESSKSSQEKSAVFWAKLHPMIKDILQETAIMRPHSGGPLRRLRDVRVLSHRDLDRHGEPLFSDLPEELYLSRHYSRKDLNILTAYGLESLSHDELLDRVEADVSSAESKMRADWQEKAWHTHAARALQSLYQHGPKDRIRKINLIPLEGSMWVSVASGPIYYSDSEHAIIPSDLSFYVLERQAGQHDDRRKLFEILGLKRMDHKDVIDKIFKKYGAKKPDRTFTLEDSIAHLRYLFWHPPSKDPRTLQQIVLIDK